MTEEKLDEILRELRLIRQQLASHNKRDCGCPPTYVCMNIACPRKPQITC